MLSDRPIYKLTKVYNEETGEYILSDMIESIDFNSLKHERIFCTCNGCEWAYDGYHAFKNHMKTKMHQKWVREQKKGIEQDFDKAKDLVKPIEWLKYIREEKQRWDILRRKEGELDRRERNLEEIELKMKEACDVEINTRLNNLIIEHEKLVSSLNSKIKDLNVSLDNTIKERIEYEKKCEDYKLENEVISKRVVLLEYENKSLVNTLETQSNIINIDNIYGCQSSSESEIDTRVLLKEPKKGKKSISQRIKNAFKKGKKNKNKVSVYTMSSQYEKL